MQTFLPYPSITKSLLCLDNRRLGKQRIEAYTILRVLVDPSYTSRAWRNHPAVRMWQGHEGVLTAYYEEALQVLSSRGFRNVKLQPMGNTIWLRSLPTRTPDWWGDVRFHGSHRAALLAKNPLHYSQFGWKEVPKINYFWPNNILQKGDTKQ